MDVLEILIQYIIKSGICVEKDKDIFKNYRPDDLNKLVSLHEPISFNFHHYSGMNTRRVQFIVRDTSNRDALAKGWELFKLFDGTQEVIEIFDHKFPYMIKSVPTKKYSDDKGRHHVQFDINFVVNNRL